MSAFFVLGVQTAGKFVFDCYILLFGSVHSVGF